MNIALLSKEVTDRMRSCLYVLSVIVLQTQELASRLLGSVRSFLLEDDGAPDFTGTLKALERQLREAMNRMTAADEALRLALAEELTRRTERDKFAEGVIDLLVSLRKTVDGVFVAAKMEALSLHNLRHRDATSVLRRARSVVSTFRSEGAAVMLGEARVAGARQLVDDFVDQLEPKAEELGRHHERVNEAKRLFQEARSQRDEAIASYDTTFLNTARVFEAICRLCGKDAVADRIRPAERGGRTEATPPPGDVPLPDVSPPGDLPEPDDPEPDDVPDDVSVTST